MRGYVVKIEWHLRNPFNGEIFVKKSTHSFTNYYDSHKWVDNIRETRDDWKWIDICDPDNKHTEWTKE